MALGHFRQDLFYRLNVIQLDIPPLRNRQADIDPLISHCLLRLANDYGSEPIELSTMARQRLHRYSYPGNVRELENILERAFALCDGHIINDYDLGLDDVSALFPDAHHESQTTAGRTREPGSLAVPTTGEVDLKLPEGQNLEDYMANIERALIKQALQETRWNKTAAAKNLGISFRALRYKLKKLDLE